MANEEQKEGLISKVAHLVVPDWAKAAQDRAVSAISTFVGAKYGPILELSQKNRDERDARSALRRALAEKAVERAVADNRLVDRTFERLVEEEFGRQENREMIALLAIQHMGADEPPGPDEGSTVGADWLNTFADYAQRATSESLRDMWARILAGEIRKPGAVSLKTIMFVSTLDKVVADAVGKLLPWITNHGSVPALIRAHVDLETITLLREEGLVGALDSDIHHRIRLTTAPHYITFPHYTVLYKGNEGGEFQYDAITVSRVARELALIFPIEQTAIPALSFAEFLKTQGPVNFLQVGPVTDDKDRTQPNETLIHMWGRPSVSVR